MLAVAAIIASYLIGAIPTGLIVVRLLTGEDIPVKFFRVWNADTGRPS